MAAEHQPAQPVDRFTWGILLRWGSAWVGAHWAGYNKRLCVNILPCLTVWMVWPGGLTPRTR